MFVYELRLLSPQARAKVQIAGHSVTGINFRQGQGYTFPYHIYLSNGTYVAAKAGDSLEELATRVNGWNY